MKKYFLMLLVAMVSLTASAQVYVGGQVGFWRNADANHTNFNLIPEVGYHFNDKVDLGLQVGFVHDYNGTDGNWVHVKTNGFTVSPYVRYSFVEFGPVSLFLDGTFGVNTYKAKGELAGHDVDGESQLGWRIGVVPGVKVSLAKNIDFVATAGFLGYQDADDSFSSFGENGFGFQLDGQNLNFGLLYNF